MRDRAQNYEERPHREAMHEWWYFTIQNPEGETGCGPWQAMVTFLADGETGADHLLFTALVDGEPVEMSEEYRFGSLQRAYIDAGPAVSLSLGDSVAEGSVRGWSIEAKGHDAELHLRLEPTADGYWRRRAPEGWGVLEITFAVRASAEGWLRIGDTTCAVAGGVGSYEHVWGTWSRVPMWGVDFLNAHVPGWSVYARRTPMRGGDNFFPAIGVDEEGYWPPAMILSDGEHHFVAAQVSFSVQDSATTHPSLGIPYPASYTVTGSGFSTPQGGSPPATVTLTVAEPSLATILLETTRSGVLEGWGSATLNIDGVVSSGTAEVEMQRYGTAFPH